MRNFLSRHQMKRTLNMFQTEWYTMQQNGTIPADSETVDDAYSRNRQARPLFTFHTATHTRGSWKTRSCVSRSRWRR